LWQGWYRFSTTPEAELRQWLVAREHLLEAPLNAIISALLDAADAELDAAKARFQEDLERIEAEEEARDRALWCDYGWEPDEALIALLEEGDHQRQAHGRLR
jgi:hypothetical protein